MKKKDLFEEYIKPEMVVIDVEMEGVICTSGGEDISENSQMQGFDDSWDVWK